MSLAEIYADHSTPNFYGDKGTAHSYIEEYERLLKPFRDTTGDILEIGIAQGHSMALWSKYFPFAHIYGVDITNMFFHKDHVDPNRVHLNFYVNGTDEEVLMKLHGNKKFKIIIDDGSHKIEDQLESFRILSPLLDEGGLYIIEDIQDIDADKERFLGMTDKYVEILDLRDRKGKYDDILVVVHNGWRRNDVFRSTDEV